MNNNFFKKIIFSIFSFIVFISILNPHNSFSATRSQLDKLPGGTNIEKTVDAGGKGLNISNDLPTMVGLGIKLILGLLATIALVFMVKAGIDWILAKGEQPKIKKSREVLTAAVIGMFIIVISYALSDFVLNQITVIGG